MSTLHFRRIERRRTPRVAVFADLTVQGYTENNEKFKVQTRSLSVSGHGGMTILDAGVVVGQTLLVTNENSGQKMECKVVSLRPGGDGKSIVAFEFIGPCANFWKISFPAQGAKALRRAAPATVTP
jgi:c-di-GMP-binding flagellar brake protein YcgR